MIFYFGAEREYVLNECEKQEIENLYQRGGRYLRCNNAKEYIGVFTKGAKGEGAFIAKVFGDTAKVLITLGVQREDIWIPLFDIMQKYPNKRQIKLTEYEKDMLRYMYNKLGCRYYLLNGSTVAMYNDKKLPISTEEFDRLESVIFNLHLKAGDEIYDDGGYISLEKIINKFCN